MLGISALSVFCRKKPRLFACDLSGLGRLGVEVALINFNLRNESLIHTLKISSAKHIFMGQSKYLVLISQCDRYVHDIAVYLVC